MFLLLFQIVYSCTPYQCAPSDFQMPTSFCAVSYNGTFFLSTCAKSNFCDISSGKCLSEPTPSPSPHYPGEKCVKNLDCLSNLCLNSTCQGRALDSKCSSHEDCAPGLRCAKGTCQKQLDQTEFGCTDEYDCINSAGCNIGRLSYLGTCMAYFSVPIGQTVSDCVEGFSYLCKSTECRNTGLFGTYGVCKTSFVSASNLPVKCLTSDDCLASDGSQSTTGECVCGYSSKGNSYCSIFSGDMPGLIYYSEWKKALISTIGVCNTVRRFEEDCLKTANSYVDMLRMTWQYFNYPLIQDNDDCVKLMITYEAYETDFALSLVLSTLFLW